MRSRRHAVLVLAAVLAAWLAPLALPSRARSQSLPPRATGTAVGYELAGAALPQAELDRLPERVATALAGCASEAAPLVGRPVAATLTIAPPGRVTAVRIAGEARSDEQAGRACVERALEGLRFPARPRATTLTIELAFRAERGSGGGSAAGDDPRTAAYRESVVRVIESHQPAVFDCFERSRRALESPERRLRVELTIAADGRPRVAIPAGDLFPQLTECLTREVQRWRLPRPPSAPFAMDHRFEGQVAAYGE